MKVLDSEYERTPLDVLSFPVLFTELGNQRSRISDGHVLLLKYLNLLFGIYRCGRRELATWSAARIHGRSFNT